MPAPSNLCNTIFSYLYLLYIHGFLPLSQLLHENPTPIAPIREPGNEKQKNSPRVPTVGTLDCMGIGGGVKGNPPGTRQPPTRRRLPARTSSHAQPSHAQPPSLPRAAPQRQPQPAAPRRYPGRHHGPCPALACPGQEPSRPHHGNQEGAQTRRKSSSPLAAPVTHLPHVRPDNT
jgi:hypothetical protein